MTKRSIKHLRKEMIDRGLMDNPNKHVNEKFTAGMASMEIAARIASDNLYHLAEVMSQHFYRTSRTVGYGAILPFMAIDEIGLTTENELKLTIEAVPASINDPRCGSW